MENAVYFYYLLYNLIANAALPGGSGTTIRHNTTIRVSHGISHHAQTKQVTQSYSTIMNTLHAMNITQKSKA
jgi:hypothetical protein